MNILFVCKYNRFRSKVAEAYFKKINKNKFIKTDGAGIFGGWYPLDPIQIKVAKKYNINLKGKPNNLTYQRIKWADLIIISANDVPKRIFKETFVGKRRVIKWWIPDVKNNKTKEYKTERIIKLIIKKVDNLNRKLA